MISDGANDRPLNYRHKERGQEKRGEARTETCNFAFACSCSHIFLSRSFSASDGIRFPAILQS